MLRPTLSAPILAWSQPTKKSRLRMCLQEAAAAVTFTNYSVFDVKPVLLGVKNYFDP